MLPIVDAKRERERIGKGIGGSRIGGREQSMLHVSAPAQILCNREKRNEGFCFSNSLSNISEQSRSIAIAIG